MNYYGAKELADSFRTVRKNTILVAEDIPEGKYSFRAAPGYTLGRRVARSYRPDAESAGAHSWNRAPFDARRF